VRAVRAATRLPLDVHLMIVEPEQHLKAFADAGADIVTVHLEASTHLHRTIQQIRGLGMKPSVSLNPHTPITGLQVVLPELAMVLIMSVNPGFAGQRFIEAVVPKVRALRQEIARRELPLDIEVDGGVNAENAPMLVAAGASVLVAGTSVFHQDDYRTAIAALRGTGGARPMSPAIFARKDKK
jgi:ribulose-phosphate 3-epimerase